MKMRIVLATALLTTASAHALEPLRPYDNFSAAPLDLTRWNDTFGEFYT